MGILVKKLNTYKGFLIQNKTFPFITHKRSPFKTSPETAKASALLQGLCEHLIFANVVIADGAAGKAHGLLEMVLPDLRHWVILFHLLSIHNSHVRKSKSQCQLQLRYLDDIQNIVALQQQHSAL